MRKLLTFLVALRAVAAVNLCAPVRAGCIIGVGLALSVSTAHAADLLYISEYTAPGISRGLVMQIPQEASLDQVTADFTSAAVQSNAFKSSTNIVRLICTVQCSVLFGTNPTATNTDKPLAAMTPEYFAVPQGGTFKVSVHTSVTPSGAPMTTPVLALGGNTSTLPSTTAESWGALQEGSSTSYSSTVSYKVNGAPIPVAGTFSNLNVTVTGSPTGPWSIGLFQNSGSATALQCEAQSSNSWACSSTSSVTVAAGDVVGWAFCPGAAFSSGTCTPVTTTGATAFQVSATFVSTNNNESFLVGGNSGNASNSVVGYAAFGGMVSAWNTTENLVSIVMPAAGTIDHLYAVPYTSPGSGTWTVSVYHNGAASSVVCTINSASECSDLTADSVTVAAGDTISFQTSPTSTPTAGPIHAAVRWKPTTPGQSILATSMAGAFATTLSDYASVMAQAAPNTPTEANTLTISSSISGGFTITDLWYCMSSDPGSGKSRTITLRAPSGTPTAVTGALTGGASQTVACGGSSQPGFSGTASLTGIAGSTTLDWQASEIGTPAAITWAKISAVMTVP